MNTTTTTTLPTDGEIERLMPTYSRGWDILSPLALGDRTVLLIGAGGIGSHVGTMLGRLGIPFTVYDDDRIEQHNLSNQLYHPNGVGLFKAIALKAHAPLVEIAPVTDKWYGQELGDIIISGVDSQDARRTIWSKVKNSSVSIYFDLRMGGEVGQMYAIQPSNQRHHREYENILRANPENDPCHSRAIAYNLFTLTGIFGKMFQLYLTGRKYPNEVHFDLRGMEAEAMIPNLGYW